MTILGVSNSFTGPSLGIELQGNHCYAYSGAVTATNTLDTVLDFQTGNYYVDAVFQLTPAIDLSNVGGGVVSVFEIQFNGSTVCLTKSDSSSESMPVISNVNLVIPPYTQVTVKIDSSSATGSATQMMTGRIYR